MTPFAPELRRELDAETAGGTVRIAVEDDDREWMLADAKSYPTVVELEALHAAAGEEGPMSAIVSLRSLMGERARCFGCGKPSRFLVPTESPPARGFWVIICSGCGYLMANPVGTTVQREMTRGERLALREDNRRENIQRFQEEATRRLIG